MTKANQSIPLVLIFSEDLFVMPRLQDTLEAYPAIVEIVERPADLGINLPSVSPALNLTEPLEGGEAILVRELRARHPALLLFDLTAAGIPWARWIQILKTSAATRRIPIVAFGPHVEENTFKIAREAGADQVLPRGALINRPTEVVENWAHLPDHTAIADACKDGLSNLAREGILLHNQGEFFEAHEALEHAWLAEPGAQGDLYRSLLQITVAFLHLERGNSRGAKKMMLRVRQWLDPLPDECRGIDVADLKQNVEALRTALDHYDPDSVDEPMKPFRFLEV